MIKLSLLFAFINIQEIVLTIDPSQSDLQKWEAYKAQFNKKYETPDEDKKKMDTYFENLKKIDDHNSRFEQGLIPYEMGMNDFGDMTEEEFKETYASASTSAAKPAGVPGLPISHSQVNNEETDEEAMAHFNITFPPSCASAPREKNWVHEGAVTRVKNQGKCGCCWAFSVAAGIESHAFIHTKKLHSLSPQNILDCVRDRYGVENSCKVGSMISALRYVVDNGGIETEHDYPYQENQSDTCNYDPSKKAVTIKDFKRIKHGDIDQMRDVVGLIGPVICGFDAELVKFIQFYKSGIFFSDTCGDSMESINHSLLIVGYGTEGRLDYWLVKNSWGEGWGNKGYARIAKLPNTCGIATDAYFPVF